MSSSYDVMSGHALPKLADFAICRARLMFLDSQRMNMYYMLVYWCLWMSLHRVQLTHGQGHTRPEFIGAVF